MGEASDDDEVARLLERIRDRIGPGETSRGDQELLAHFTPAPERLDHGVEEELLQQIDQLRHIRQSLPPFPSASRVPGGRQFHRLVGKSVRRDTAALAAQIESLTNQIAAAMDALVYGLAKLTAERIAHDDHVRAAERTRFVDSLDRLWTSHEASIHHQNAIHETLQHQSTQLDGLEARLASIVAGPSAHKATDATSFRPEFSSLAFADRFRGSREEMLIRYADVADRLVATGGPVLDLGCGRGELVELIMAKGGVAHGVEVDPELVAFCRSLYLGVTQASAVDALNDAGDESLGGIALIQVIEHLGAQELAELIPLAHGKLKAGGLLVAETVNGTSPFVFTRSFYADPAHTNPVHHEYLHFLLEASGFTDVKVEWRSLVAKADRLSAISESRYSDATAPGKRLVRDTNARLKQLDKFLFGPQDYLIVARK